MSDAEEVREYRGAPQITSAPHQPEVGVQPHRLPDGRVTGKIVFEVTVSSNTWGVILTQGQANSLIAKLQDTVAWARYHKETGSQPGDWV